MQFFLEKRLEKRKSIHHTPCQPVIPVDRLCYKMGQSIHQFYKKFLHFSRNGYDAMEKKQS